MVKIKNKILIVFLGPFPKGNVSTIRIISYAKALVAQGFYVKVVIPSPTNDAAVNNLVSGNFKGIDYTYLKGITWSRKTSLFNKLFVYINGLVNIGILLKNEKYNCVIAYDSEIVRNLFLSVYSKIFNIKLVLDITEYPKGFFRKSTINKSVERLSLFGFKKVISITHELVNFYNKWLNIQTFLLPMTVDPEPFRRDKVTPIQPYILAMFGTHNRDSLIDTVIGYICYLKQVKVCPLKLLLVGDFDTLKTKYSDVQIIDDLILENNIKNLVEFKGLISSDQIPNLLFKATCLITTPIEYESGGFPTKLGEYLLSARPVIASKIGELDLFLTHNKNIFFVKAGDHSDIGNKLLYVHDNLDDANLVGKEGFKLALYRFNASTYLDELLEYIYK